MILLGILALSCGPKQRLPRGVEGDVTTWAPPPKEVTFDLVTVIGQLGLPAGKTAMTWAGPKRDGVLEVYEVTVEDRSATPPRPIEGYRQAYGPMGLVLLGVVDDQGAYHAWEPAQMLLPSRPRIGQTWSGTHARDGESVERSCEILRSELCGGGQVAVCDTRFSDGHVQIIRDHYCPGLGWIGFEALQQRPEQASVRTWTENLQRDGVGVPDAPR